MKPIAKFTTLLALTGVVSFCPRLALAESPASTAQAEKPAPGNPGRSAPTPPQGQGGITERSLGGSSSNQESGGGPGEERKPRERDWMRHHGREIAAKLQEMQARLDEKLATMNAATGRDKLDAMAAVINEMVHQHDQILNHIIQMQQHRTERMHGGGEDEENDGEKENE